MGGFNFNPVLSEIQSHLQAMSPGAQAAVKMANPSLPSPASPSTPTTTAPGMLLPHPDAGAPLGPISMGASAPSLSASPSPQPNIKAPLGTVQGDTEARGTLLNEKPGVDSIYHDVTSSRLGEAHPFLGKLLGGVAEVGGKIGDTLAGGFPGIGREIPGTTVNHNMLLKQANTNLTQDVGNEQKEAQTANENATAGKTTAETPEIAPNAESTRNLQGAEAEHAEAETEALKTPSMVVHDTESGPLLINPKTGAAQHVDVDGQPVGPKLKLTQSQPIDGPDGKPHTYMLDDKGNKVVDLGVHYERPINVNAGEKNLWSVTQPDGSKKVVSLKAGDTIPKGAVSLSGQNSEDVAAGKPTADEQRRADLAENLRENFTQLRDIISRRPELFGPLSGRWAELRQKFGTDDPDLAALQTIEHQVGMAQISAHGMRSAQGVQSAADSIMNHLHSGPKGLLSSLDAAEHSVGTFTGDVENKGKTGQPTQSGNATDPLGIR